MAFRLPEYFLRRLIRRGELARALYFAGPEPSFEILSRLRMHLTVLGRRDQARRQSELFAVSLALASLGRTADALTLAEDLRSHLSDVDQMRFAAAIALWGAASALNWLPADRHLARAATHAACSDIDAAEHELSLATHIGNEQEKLALRAMVAGLRGNHAERDKLLHALLKGGGNVTGATENAEHTRVTVSVLMPARNAATSIADAIRSVLSQTHKALELIVVDDASSDNTADVARSAFAGDRRARLVTLTGADGSAATARNCALNEASGSLIALQDADDYSRPDRIARAVALVRASGAMAVVGNLVRVDQCGHIVAPRVFPLVRLNPSSLVFRADPVLSDLGCFDPVTVGSDTEFISRIVTRYGYKALIRDREVSMLVKLRAGSLTHNSDSAINVPAAAERRIGYHETWLRRHCEAIRSNRYYFARRLGRHFQPSSVPASPYIDASGTLVS